MWCRSCRQDVPAVAGAADEPACCIRCGSVVLASRPTAASAATLTTTSTTSTVDALSDSVSQIVESPSFTIRAPLSSFDTWALEEQLKHVDRILSGARFKTEVRPEHTDAPSPVPAPRAKIWKKRSANNAKAGAPTTIRMRLAWTIVALGAAALATGICMLCGGALLGHARWQSFGLPITLLGQVALLLGMMMQLDLVWHGKRETASKLYRFQKRLGDLEVLADELTPTSEESPPPVNEQELMAELKNRLDLLSHRLNVPCG
ncbi:MAG TPA: hypothetical protein VGJ26_00450 [Pirellulales bacterium]